MKKLLLGISLMALGCFFFFSKKGRQVKNVAIAYVVPTSLVNEEGTTVSQRIVVPEGFQRKEYPVGNFSAYIQNYPLKSFESEVINYNGKPYVYQGGHVGVFELSVPSHGLMQCADALIRLRAEYLWEQDKKEAIGFQFTSGHYCSWKEYAAGFRPQITGNKVSFLKTAKPNSSKANFYNYLDLIYTYAGTISLQQEMLPVATVDDIEVGDMLIYPGSLGHVIMVVDKAVNAQGKNLFIFAQGNTPSQSVHILKNVNDVTMSPWYDIVLGEPLEIPAYRFETTKFIRFK
ncbi:MAG: DUF4846 domain-containing protein [Flavobacteriaceae bacterium]